MDLESVHTHSERIVLIIINKIFSFDKAIVLKLVQFIFLKLQE